MVNGYFANTEKEIPTKFQEVAEKQEKLETELHSEIEKIVISDQLVKNWTYPDIQPKLLEEAEVRGFI